MSAEFSFARCGALGRAAAALALAATLTTTAPTSTAAGELELDLGAVSAYVFRGAVLNPEACLQPEATLSLGSFSLDAWASLNLTDEVGRGGELGEVDLAAAFTGSMGSLEVTTGMTHYRYSTPEAGHTTELFFDVVVPRTVELRIGLAWDVDAARGVYVRAALGLPLELTDKLSLDLEAGAAWADAGMNAYNFGVAQSTLADSGAKAVLELKTHGVTLWTSATASWLWQEELRLGAEELYGDASPFVVAAGLSASWPRRDN